MIEPYLRSWKVTGTTPHGEAVTLSEVRDSDMLGDHAVHRFSFGTDVSVNEMTLQMTGHNNAGSPQLHVGRFILGGRICYRSSMLDGRSVISAIVAEIHKVGIPAKRESHAPQLMMEMPDLEDVETLSGSRFGHIRVTRAVSGELFAVERYNTGASTATQSAIVLTPFSGIRSLDDVLTQVRQGSPPPLWNNATITRILIQVARGLDYLHRQTIVHANLKPSDIIADDGSAKVCGYLTAFLEDTGLTQVSAPHADRRWRQSFNVMTTPPFANRRKLTSSHSN